MTPSTNSQKTFQDPEIRFACDHCDKIYTLKSSFQSHMRTKHKELIKMDKNKALKTAAKLYEQQTGSINVNQILEEIFNKLPDKKEYESFADPIDEDANETPKNQIDPTDGWLTHTNTDLGLMLECAEAELSLDVCEECGYTLEFNESLNEHKKNEHLQQLSKVCSTCGEFFRTITSLNKHSLTKHTPAFSSKTACKECVKLKQIEELKNVALEKKEETIIKMVEKLQNLAKEKKNIVKELNELKESKKENKDKEDESENNKSDNNPAEGKKCRKCKFIAPNLDGLYNHMHQKHRNKYKCNVCSLMFIYKTTLKCHMKLKHNVKETKQGCNECKMNNEVARHKELELDKKDKNLEKKETELEQLHQKHEAMKERYTNVLRSLGDKKQLFKENTKLREENKSSTDELQKAYKKVQTLEETNKVMKAVIDADETLKENQEFRERTADMTEEVREHNRPFIHCPKCNYKTKNSTHIKGHMTAHKDVSFLCEEEDVNSGIKCGKMFKTKVDIENHMKVSHKEETIKFKCNKCDKEFETHNALNQHAQSKHEAAERLPVGHHRWATQQNANRGADVTKYKCTKCPAEFSTERDLAGHVKTHVFVIPCNLCNEMFETKQDQNHHNRTAHEGFRKVQNICRYFAQGWCDKQDMCNFSHNTPQNQRPQYEQEQQSTPCRRGPGCLFWARGTCYFVHATRGGVQGQYQEGWRQGQEQYQRSRRQEQEQYKSGRRQGQEQHQEIMMPAQEQGQEVRVKSKMCHFQERCWNQECNYKHEDFSKSTQFLENY